MTYPFFKINTEKKKKKSLLPGYNNRDSPSQSPITVKKFDVVHCTGKTNCDREREQTSKVLQEEVKYPWVLLSDTRWVENYLSSIPKWRQAPAGGHIPCLWWQDEVTSTKVLINQMAQSRSKKVSNIRSFKLWCTVAYDYGHQELWLHQQTLSWWSGTSAKRGPHKKSKIFC